MAISLCLVPISMIITKFINLWFKAIKLSNININQILFCSNLIVNMFLLP